MCIHDGLKIEKSPNRIFPFPFLLSLLEIKKLSLLEYIKIFFRSSIIEISLGFCIESLIPGEEGRNYPKQGFQLIVEGE